MSNNFTWVEWAGAQYLSNDDTEIYLVLLSNRTSLTDSELVILNDLNNNINKIFFERYLK